MKSATLILYPIVLAVVVGAAAPAATATPDWSAARRVTIDLSNFKFAPDHLTLHHGQPYDLRFVNRASGGHDFTAKSFFASAQVDPADRNLVGNGEVELAGGATADVHLIAPAAGRYEVHCGHFMHTMFGMKAIIEVD